MRAALLQAALFAPLANAEEEGVLKLAVQLTDGSVVVGVPAADKLPVKTSYATMTIPLKALDTIEFSEDRERATLAFANGDQLVGVLAMKALELRTLFGTVKVGLELVSAVDIRTGGPLSPGLARGLLLHYSFDRDEGGRASDTSGNGHEGTAAGPKWIRAGGRGGAYEFDGIDDYIDCGNVKRLNFAKGEFSVSVWVKSKGTGYRMLVSKLAPGDASRGWGLRLCDTKAHIYFWAFESRASYRDARYYTASIMDGKWHHVVGVKTGGGGDDMHVYVDGKEVTSQQTGKGDAPQFGSTGRALIGGGQRAWFQGRLDDVMMFERGLSAAEVKGIFEAQLK